MGLLCPKLVAFFFDSKGNLLGHEKRAWSDDAAKMVENNSCTIYSDGFRVLIDKQKKEWQAELGFRPATIRVKAFYDGEYPVGIQVLPEHYKDIETATWFRDEEDRQEFIKSRDRWLAEENFVWWWARDYYMSKDGDVEST